MGVKISRSMLTMYQQITIKTLHNQGEKKSRIARELGCHRNTVSNIIKRDGIIEKQTRVKSSVFDPYKGKIWEYLDKKISRLRIFELLGEEYGVMSTYINLRKYIQNQFPKRIEAYGVQTTEPGEVAEIDFGYLGMLPGYLGRPVKTYDPLEEAAADEWARRMIAGRRVAVRDPEQVWGFKQVRRQLRLLGIQAEEARPLLRRLSLYLRKRVPLFDRLLETNAVDALVDPIRGIAGY